MNVIAKKRDAESRKNATARRLEVPYYDSRSPKIELYDQLKNNRLMFRPNSPSNLNRISVSKDAVPSKLPQKQPQEESVKLRESATRLMNSEDGTVGSLWSRLDELDPKSGVENINGNRPSSQNTSLKQIPKLMTSPHNSSRRTLTKELITNSLAAKANVPSKLVISSKDYLQPSAGSNILMTQQTPLAAQTSPQKKSSLIVSATPKHYRTATTHFPFQSQAKAAQAAESERNTATVPPPFDKDASFKDLLNDKMGYDWEVLRARDYSLKRQDSRTGSSLANPFLKQFTIKKLTSLEVPSADRGRRFIAFSELHTSEPTSGFEQSASNKPGGQEEKQKKLEELRDILAWNKKEAEFYSSFMQRRKEDPIAPVIAERFKAPLKQRNVTDQKVYSYRSLQREINQKSKLMYKQIVKDAEKGGYVDKHISEIKKKIEKIEHIKQLAKRGYQVHLKSTSRNNSLDLSAAPNANRDDNMLHFHSEQHEAEALHSPNPQFAHHEALEVGVTDLNDLDFEFRRVAEHEDFGLIAKKCNIFTVMTPPQVRHSFCAIVRQAAHSLFGKKANEILVIGGMGGEPLDTIEVFMTSNRGLSQTTASGDRSEPS